MSGYEKINIQWFPGHMTKAERMIEENMKLVDGVCEVIDARIPLSSRNPDIDRLAEGKPRLVVLNRADQADPEATKLWRAYLKGKGQFVLETDSKTGKGINQFPNAVRMALKDKIAEYQAKGQGSRPLRMMVVGIPNVGKSTFINKVAKRKAAIAGDRPGVTRGKQWIHIDETLDLLDTPGILWPKFDDENVGQVLAITGAVKDDILDRETLAANFFVRLRDHYPMVIENRYKFQRDPELPGYEPLETAARKRGFLISGGELDTERMAAILLDEYRGGKLGRLTLEYPPED